MIVATLRVDDHELAIRQLPDDQFRSECSCGWLGGSWLRQADAQLEAEEHALEVIP